MLSRPTPADLIGVIIVIGVILDSVFRYSRIGSSSPARRSRVAVDSAGLLTRLVSPDTGAAWQG